MLCSYMCTYVDVGDVYIVCCYGFVCAGHGYISCPYDAHVGSDWILCGTCFDVRYFGLWVGRPLFSMVGRQAGLFVSAFCLEALFLECYLAPTGQWTLGGEWPW